MTIEPKTLGQLLEFCSHPMREGADIFSSLYFRLVWAIKNKNGVDRVARKKIKPIHQGPELWIFPSLRMQMLGSMKRSLTFIKPSTA